MKKQTTLMLCITALFLSAQAGIQKPDFKKLRQQITKTILAQQNPNPQNNAGRATASRLVSKASYEYGTTVDPNDPNNTIWVRRLEDSSKLFYNSNITAFPVSTINSIYIGAFGVEEFDPTETEYWRYDSLVDFYYGGDTTPQSTYSTKREYNGQNKLSAEKYDDGRINYTYNAQGKLTQVDYQELISTVFITIYRYRMVYSGSGRLDTLYISEVENNALVENYFLTFNYNPSGKLSSFIEHKKVVGTWVQDGKTEYSYTAGGLLSSEMYYNGSNQQRGKTIYAYDGQNRRVKYVNYDWDDQLLELYIDDSTLTQYPAANQRLDSTMGGSGGSVRKTLLNNKNQPILEVVTAYYNYSYDPQTQTFVYTWGPANDSTTFSYNVYDQPTAEKGKWNENFYNYETYNAVSGIADVLPVLAAKIYPNPATDVLNISISEQLEGNMNIRVYNQSGQLLQHTAQPAMQQTNINVSQLPAGAYTVVVEGGNKRFSSTLLKQ